MNISLQRKKAEALRALHQGPEVLVLANVWDAVSACIVEASGAKAIATSSAAIAFTLGYPDGEYISRREMLEAVARIVRVVSVPVTADLEAGYSDSLQEIEGLVHEMITAGAVGLNLEDGATDDPPYLRPLELQVEKIKTIKEVSGRAGVPSVINARTDVYLRKIGEPSARFAEAVSRGRAYREAGADCIFNTSRRGAGDNRRLGQRNRRAH
jgi:2-methylisocitrate lyase-like PEP mutase family enzyme